MEFLGVGLPELLVILVITLIFVGPQRLPEMAAQIARAMREFRRYTSSLSREVTEALEDIEKEYSAVQEEWKDVGEAVRQDMKALEAEVSGAAADVRSALSEAERPSSGEKPASPAPSKVVSMEDAASRRAQTGGRPQEGSSAADAGTEDDRRPAGQSRS
jgi:sec-independent protein translocase protein TatB